MSTPESGPHDCLEKSITGFPGLTEEEKRQLAAVLQKAKEFEEEEENQLRKPVEGQLYKYTNVVKGWQFRWFILTPETGMLEYYMMEETKKNRPKGGLHLAGAIILPSEEDSHSFTVSDVCGEVYRLKAFDARERQFWVNRLRATVGKHTTGSPIEILNHHNRVQRTISQSLMEACSIEQSPKSLTASEKRLSATDGSEFSGENWNSQPSGDAQDQNKDNLASIKECVENAASNQKAIATIIEQLPIDGPHLKCSDSALLLLKATSQATVQSLEYCYLILQKRELERTRVKGPSSGATVQRVNSKKGMNDSSKK